MKVSKILNYINLLTFFLILFLLFSINSYSSVDIENKEKFEKNLLYWEELALNGDPEAQYNLGLYNFIGFNNERHGDYTILIIGILLLPVVFYCIYRGLKLVLEAIFE